MWQQATLGYQYADPYGLASRRQVGTGLLSTPGGLLSPSLITYPQVDTSSGLMVLPCNVPQTVPVYVPASSVGTSENIKVNWATTSARKEKSYSLFVGDLASEVDQELLAKAFRPFGVVLDSRVVKDQSTGHSRGYGFVAFAREADAESAMKQMNGAVLGGKPIRTNWASRKQNTTKSETKEYDDVYKKTSNSNTTVYIGNTPDNYSESEVREMFDSFGQILEVRVYADRNYAFVKYSDHDQAAQAIVGCHGQPVQDRQLRCDWGKEDTQHKSTSGMAQPFLQQQQQQQQQQAYQQAALLYNSFSQQQSPFQQQQPQQQFSGNPPPGMYGQQPYVGSNQSQMYPYFESVMMQTSQFPSYGQDGSHSTFMNQSSNSAATSQGGFGYQQQ